jgi:acyl-CoA synthetase (AMP-forming)/AMP-acid ligase II
MVRVARRSARRDLPRREAVVLTLTSTEEYDTVGATVQPEGDVERAAHYRTAGLWDDRVLADGVDAAAAGRPDAVALVDNQGQVTYAELADRLAGGVARLAAAGVRPGEPVVLVAGNTVPAVIAYHSLLRLGATAVLLDRRCGAADVRHALEALPSVARVLVPTGDRDRLLEGHSVEPILLDAFGIDGPAAPPADWVEPDRDAAAVVLFTSGTTSRPKAVIHSLNTLTAGAANMARITSADERTVAFLVSPVTSIAGVMQMHLVADVHATLVLEDDFDPDASLERIHATGASLLGGAPVIAERLLRAAERRPDRRAGLRTLALGGAMLPRPLLEVATDVFGIEITRVYGSSEAPNFSGSLPGDSRERRLADDGALMPGNEVRTGSADHPGEGLVRGPCVFLGYVADEDNAAAFEDGWFRTGDLVEVDRDRLTVTGRLKEVVNRNGLKISLHEIDGALADLPEAVEAASFGVPDPISGEHLAVAVRLRDGARLTLADVVNHLSARGTARRKLPEQLVFWGGPLPRTTSGKVVRSRLLMESASKRSERR